jgi:predicted GH43/DUF377 family glycosyl hydrolase
MITPTLILTTRDHGYNPSVIDFNGRRLMSYRYHPVAGQWRTLLMMQEVIDGAYQERPIHIGGHYHDMSQEDGRLFIFRGKLHISFTLAVFPGVPNATVPCVCAYGELVDGKSGWTVEKVVIPKVGNNNWQAQEKNFVFFEHDGKLHLIYQCSPEQVIYRLGSENNIEEVYRTKSPSWIHGEIRGGTQPVSSPLSGGSWLRFFHSLHKAGNNRHDWTYSIGAMEMADTPPFNIIRISKYPVFSGDERFVPGCRHWKQGVAIPYGAVNGGDSWIVSAGLNDSMAAMLNVGIDDLHL